MGLIEADSSIVFAVGLHVKYVKSDMYVYSVSDLYSMCVFFYHHHIHIALYIVKHCIYHSCKLVPDYMHVSKMVSMFKIFSRTLCFVSTFNNLLKPSSSHSSLDLCFGRIARLLQRGQTAVLFGAAGHGPVCFLSTVEFI